MSRYWWRNWVSIFAVGLAACGAKTTNPRPMAPVANTSELSAPGPEAPPRRRASELAPDSFAFVLQLGAPYVVLATRAKAAWGDGPVTGLPSVGLRTMRQGVALDRLPVRLGRWHHRRVTLFRGARRICSGEIRDLHLLTRVHPEAGARTPERQLLAMAAELGGQYLIAGRVVPLGSKPCENATWARDAALPDPSIYAPAPRASRQLRKRALQAFRDLRSYASLQREFLAEARQRRVGRWEYYRKASPTVRLFGRDGRRRFVVVSAQVGEGCGDFFAAQWAVWEVKGDRLVLRSGDTVAHEHFVPVAVLDTDGDGREELLGENLLLQHRNGYFKKEVDLNLPYRGCLC